MVAPARTPCSLQALEHLSCWRRRTADVPGSEIPAVGYFHFVLYGDARPLVAVLEHNRRDLLSAGWPDRAIGSSGRRGPDGQPPCARGGRPWAGWYAPQRSGQPRPEIVRRACTEALAGSSIPSIKVEARKALSLLCRRARRFEEAAVHWRELLEIPSCPPGSPARRARRCAVHHEHRVRDLLMARAFALQSFDAQKPAWNQAVQYRLARLERKMNNSQPSRLNFEGTSSLRVEG